MLPMFGCYWGCIGLGKSGRLSCMIRILSVGVVSLHSSYGSDLWYLFRMSSGGWCPGPDDGSLAETYESQCGQDASVGRLQNLSARRSQSLRCTSVTKLMYTPRHCFVTHCRAYSFCGFVWNAHIGHKAYVHTQALFCDTLPCISFLRFCVECAMYLTNQCTC